ncbi:MAG: metal ABC transporter ATP-binding protein [Alphaproteobacteria bacterium]|nr:metal ABC transporter ATP-binding protein [Alphaproteobacteria bacterium]OJV17241.1 MAG: hypothetical protein BGO27_06160 [Alphaproteobacteria bacterium 33-17]
MTHLLEVKNLSLKVQGKSILENISFAIDSQEIITIIGPNGSGKSSLVKTIIGKYLPTSGKIIKKPNLKIGYVPQKFDIANIPPITVKEFLNLYGKNIDSNVSNFLNKDIKKLSGGELQRVLFARSIMNNPDLLVLDEPTQGLDVEGVKEFYKKLLEVKEERKISIILSSHDLNFVMKNTDRVICLNQHICCQGKPKDIALDEEFIKIYGSDLITPYKHEHNHCH